MVIVRHKKKNGTVPFINQARGRHVLDTKTNRCVPNTYTNYQTYWKIAPEVHCIPTHSLKPASPKTDLTPVPLGDAQARSFRCKPKISLLQVAILGVTQHAP